MVTITGCMHKRSRSQLIGRGNILGAMRGLAEPTVTVAHTLKGHGQTRLHAHKVTVTVTIAHTLKGHGQTRLHEPRVTVTVTVACTKVSRSQSRCVACLQGILILAAWHQVRTHGHAGSRTRSRSRSRSRDIFFIGHGHGIFILATYPVLSSFILAKILPRLHPFWVWTETFPQPSLQKHCLNFATLFQSLQIVSTLQDRLNSCKIFKSFSIRKIFSIFLKFSLSISQEISLMFLLPSKL